ncbi:RAD14 (YMR201C) [Zygosaccharomyces parabailii]|nr:RAD14 (YMR201C) [Zygosaccharomyces parabailii]
MNAEQRARVEANRKKALERLRKRGILKDAELQHIEKRNEPAKEAPNTTLNEQARDKVVTEHNSIVTESQAPASASKTSPVPHESQPNEESKKRPLERIRPSIRTKDYIEYDFSTMKNLNGGYINPEDRLTGFDEEDVVGSKRQKTLDEWKKEQQERKYLYENAPPPEHISQAPKCTECNINIEMDPVLDDVFKIRVCKSCVKRLPEKYSLLTKTECKDDYFLTEPELNDEAIFHRLEKPNPHSGTFARMQLFVRCEVEDFAFKKWGGEQGLDAEWHRREEGKAQRREKKYQKEMLKMRMKTRAQEYTTRIREKRHGKKHTHIFSNPIEGGTDEDGHKLLRRRCTECGLETEEVAL